MNKSMEQIMQELQAPFPPEDIEWRVGSTNKEKTKGLALAYVTNRAIQSRLDQVFGLLWKNEFRDWKGNGVLCGISAKIEGEWITKWDGAEETDFESTKGGLSDAMKRAGYQWGIGRYLYKLPAVWVPIEQRGKSYVIKETPELPDWALPPEYKPTVPTIDDVLKQWVEQGGTEEQFDQYIKKQWKVKDKTELKETHLIGLKKVLDMKKEKAGKEGA